MSILVTGAAGFIGRHVAERLLGAGKTVIGLDSVNDYYAQALKRARLETLSTSPGFAMIEGDLNRVLQEANADDSPWREIDTIIHLAAQPGVRYSLENPHAYVDANVHGQVSVLEFARKLPKQPHVVYASSSSVYGLNAKLPWSEEDHTDSPASLYAATKQAGERIAATYAHLYSMKLTGLRFFTVYGPWGRPDMAPYLFTRALFEGQTIRLFNHGKQRRDFTFIDDIASGVIAACDRPDRPAADGPVAHHRLYNLGNNRAEELEHFVQVLAAATGREPKLELVDAQPGDVTETYADITRSKAELGYEPSTDISEGLPRFVDWYRRYHGIN